MRKTARWQIEPDERILESLREEGWTSARTLARKPNIWLPHREVKRRLRMLADGELVVPSTPDFDLYHITTDGVLYLEGNRDQALHPHPFYYGLATAPLLR